MAIEKEETTEPRARRKEAPDWTLVTEEAQWQARDSQGEVVYDGKMWIMGGWFNSYLPAPRDVWSSADGHTWQLVQPEAAWTHSDLPMSVVFKGKMWMMGGWYNGRLEGHSASNAVWSSTDGVDWELVTESAGWSPRIASGAVVFKDHMWILGGTVNYFFGEDDNCVQNDVWRSADGKHWELVCENAPWSARAYHQVVVKDGKMWLLGGGDYLPNHHAKNDVWCSEDGVNWTLVTDNAPWEPRMWFSSVVYRDHIWVLGGWSKARDNFGDVWVSKDGLNWTELVSKRIWKSRHEHSAFVFQDKVWVVGGHARPLNSEVWSLEIPEGWLDEAEDEGTR